MQPGVLVLDRAFSIPSGVMSTRDRMLAKAGLGGVPLEAADWAVGVVGVPGDGRGDGVGARRTARTERTNQNHSKYKPKRAVIHFFNGPRAHTLFPTLKFKHFSR